MNESRLRDIAHETANIFLHNVSSVDPIIRNIMAGIHSDIIDCVSNYNSHEAYQHLTNSQLTAEILDFYQRIQRLVSKYGTNAASCIDE